MNSKARARLILAASCGAMAWRARRVLDTRSILVSWDLDGHILRAHHLVTMALRRPGFTAWFPFWHGGLPLTEVYPPLATWLLALFVPFKIDAAAARFILVIAWVAIVPCSYFFLRSFEVDRVPAALGSVLAAALNAGWSFGSFAIFFLGLLPNALGFLFGITSVGAVQRLLKAPSLAAAALAGLLGGLTILAHPFASVWTAGAWGALLLSDRLTWPARGQTAWFAVASVWALMIGSFYWAPFMANRANVLVTEPFVPRATQEVWRSMIFLDDIGGPAASLLAVAVGLELIANRSRRDRLVPFFALLLVGGILTTGALVPLYKLSPLFGKTQLGRFEGFFGWTVLMVAALAVEGAFKFGAEKSRPRAIASVVVTLVVVTVAGRGLADQSPIQLVTPAPLRALGRMATVIGPRLEPGDFVLNENSQEAASMLGSPHFLSQRLPLLNSSIYDQGGNLPEGTKSSDPYFACSALLIDCVPNSRDKLDAAGIHFVVTVRRASRDVLDQIPWLKRLWADDTVNGLALFEVEDHRRFGLPPALSARVQDANFSPRDGYVLRFSGAAEMTYPLSTAIAFHPWLIANVDGKPVATRAGDFNRLVFLDGPSTATEVQIRYVPPRWFLPVRLAALAALLGAVVVAGRRKRFEGREPSVS